MKTRAEIVDENFKDGVKKGQFPAPLGQDPIKDVPGNLLVEIFESQVLSRHLDLHSRRLQAAGEGFYTIGSSGHEGNAAIAAAFRPTDMAFLHYRDAAFLIQRSKQVTGETPLWDMLLSFTASSEDPISAAATKCLAANVSSCRRKHRPSLHICPKPWAPPMPLVLRAFVNTKGH